MNIYKNWIYIYICRYL